VESATTAAGSSAGSRPLRADVRRNRDAILASAERAFAERGPGASLEEIARDAGVGSATLHRHFPTRDILIAAVYRRQIEDLCASAGGLLACHPADEALAEWLRRFVSHVLASRGMATAIKAAACQARELDDVRITLRSAVTRLAAPAIMQGLIRPDITADDILRALAAVCLFDDQPAACAQAIRLIDLFTDGLRHGAQEHPGSP
jgi:AcrR family transcriptional regulator